MAESNLQKIENAKKRIAQIQDKIISGLGNYIWVHCKVPDTDVKGHPVKYNNGNVKKRKLNGIKEFKSNFQVVPNEVHGLHTKYLTKLGLDIMQMYGGNNDGDFLKIYNKIKVDHDTSTANDSPDKNRNNDGDDGSNNDNNEEATKDNSNEDDKTNPNQNGSENAE